MSDKYPDMRQLMNVITEDDAANEEQIAAISQLIADRTEDADSESKISTEAFIQMCNQMGLPMSQESLMDLAEKGSLGSVIKDVNMEEVVFKGQSEIDPTDMTVDKAKDVVGAMAKRSAKKAIKKEETNNIHDTFVAMSESLNLISNKDADDE